MKKSEFDSWSKNGEDFLWDCLDALLNDHPEISAGDTVHRGIKRIPDPTDYIDADCIVDDIANRAYEEVNEWADDYPNVTDEAKGELDAFLAEWLRKYCTPNFWIVEFGEEYIVTESDLIEASK